MVHIKVTRGLDIPIKGKPDESQRQFAVGEASEFKTPSLLSLNLRSFTDVKFRLLVQVGDVVAIGQPLIEDKATPGRMWVSPGAGTIKEIKRGLKRALLDIVIEVAAQEEYFPHEKIDADLASRDELISALKQSGLFTNIRSRPFGLLANPQKPPRAIFVKALESSPFAPSAELQIKGYEKEFQIGLNVLQKLTDGRVHIVYYKDSACTAFTNAKNVERHTAEGPHPVSNFSLHIQEIDPIRSADDIVWTIRAREVASIGNFFTAGHVLKERIISIAGPGIIPGRIGYARIRNGFPLAPLISNRLQKGWVRLISGDPLMGQKVEAQDFMGYDDDVFCAIPENTTREFLHFFRLGTDKYSFSGAYLSGHLDNREREYDFTTNQHGEHRAFIDGRLYDQVMPLNVPTMLLVKAVLAEDYDLAEQLGLLEVDSEDFALPTFVCPSKMEMTEIVKQGLRRYAKEVAS